MNQEKQQALQNIRTAKGQFDAVIHMLEEERYCLDISNQIAAIQSLLKKANLLILQQHLNHCVATAFQEGSGEEKTQEVMQLLDRIIGK